MAQPELSVAEQLVQLNTARKMGLSDPNWYPQLIQGILPIVGPGARLEFRRWGADFLAETFASPVVPSSSKETLSLIVLDHLKVLIDNPHEDPAVVKSVVQTAASIYPLVFKWIINNPYDRPTWEKMTVIKSAILRIWDTAVPGVRICCIKFAQRVVLVQTAAPESVDGKRRDPSEISASIAPANHELIPPQKLGAEASGLLDRMLGVFHECATDAVLIDATLNSLSILIRARPSISNKILNAILNFNPLKLANSPMTSKMRVMAKSMEKTTRILLSHILRRDPHGPLAPKISSYLERLVLSRTDVFQDAARKRCPPEPIDGLDSAKRQKPGAPPLPPPRSTTPITVPPLGPGPHTMAEIYTLTESNPLKDFDIRTLPADIVVNLVVSVLKKVDADRLRQCGEAVLKRWQSVNTLAVPAPIPESLEINANRAPLGVEEDDDYEPDFDPPAEDTEQILNKLDNAPSESNPAHVPEPEMAVERFKMPAPQPLDEKSAIEGGKYTIARVFDALQGTEDPSSKRTKAGLNRLAASTGDKDSWVTIVTRLATRASAGLDDGAAIKLESGNKAVLSDNIREALHMYVIEDFRHRIDVAVSWLCEEWYNDAIQVEIGLHPVMHYDRLALRVLEGMLQYLDAKDKVLTRFLGEIPRVTGEMLKRVQRLCIDPAMIPLSLTSLLYLVMMKPPVKEEALDAVQRIWVEYPDARTMAGKYLTKYRPEFTEQQKQKEQAAESQSAIETTA